MSPPIILLLLRLFSALLLLLFFGIIGWLTYRDLKIRTALPIMASQLFGRLRVVHAETDQQRLDHEYPLYAETRVGRSSTNTVVLDDAYTSNEHAIVRRSAGQWWLEDLDSRNGTLLNDMPLNAPAVVISGDVFTIGQTSLELDLDVSG